MKKPPCGGWVCHFVNWSTKRCAYGFTVLNPLVRSDESILISYWWIAQRVLMSFKYLVGVINFAVLGRFVLGATALTAFALGLRVLVLRTFGATVADAVIKNQICLTLLIYMKKPPSGGFM